MAAPVPSVPLADEQKAASANAAFAADLLALVRAEQGATPGNVFFSPLSITAALAMTMAGARGQTLAQMQHALRTQLPAATYHPALSQLLRGVGLGGATAAVPGVQVAVANRLWAAAGFTLQPAYLTQTERLYHARAEVCQFATNAEGERTRINGWVESQTHGRIANLIPPQLLTPATTLILTNAIYFKGDWTHAFNPERTSSAPFHRIGQPASEVQLMFQHERFPYVHTGGDEPTGGVAIVELPYGNRTQVAPTAAPTLSMLVMLPHATGAQGLADAAALLQPQMLDHVASALNPTKLKLWLPRFRLEESLGLSRLLKSMGMHDAFTGAADFGDMAQGGGLAIADVLHKAFVQVNEEGTEAAAATAVLMMRSVMRPQREPEMRVDRPFLFAIWDRRTRAVLFVGQCADPQAAQA